MTLASVVTCDRDGGNGGTASDYQPSLPPGPLTDSVVSLGASDCTPEVLRVTAAPEGQDSAAKGPGHCYHPTALLLGPCGRAAHGAHCAHSQGAMQVMHRECLSPEVDKQKSRGKGNWELSLGPWEGLHL